MAALTSHITGSPAALVRWPQHCPGAQVLLLSRSAFIHGSDAIGRR